MKQVQANMAAILQAAMDKNTNRLFGSHNIERYIKQHMLKARRYVNTSKYMPHQGARECARRIRQGVAS